MSTTELDEARTYRGRTLEELLPKIREELGPDAIVVRQRDGLMGGIGGFFQQQFVEVDARPGHPRVDVYDEEPGEADPGFAELLAAAEADAEPTVESVPAAPEPTAESVAPSAGAPARDSLAALAESVREAALAAPPAVPMPAASRGRATAAARSSEQLTAALATQGLTEQLAAQLVADATAHELPFAAGDLRAATVRALARRIPAPPPHRGAGMAVAFAGPSGGDTTRTAAALAVAYAQTAPRVVVVALCAQDGGAELTRLLAPHDIAVHAVASASAARTRLRRAPHDALVVLDTPPVSPTDPTAVAQLAAQLATLELDEVQLVVPATLDPDAAHVLHERLAPLRPTGIALSRADAPGASAGAVVDLACATRLPLAYVATGGATLSGAIAPADPVAIAERLLP